ncbi:MAG: branched-chain amino acid ABC transporter permease [Gammaproteobacteria bacterium]|uniref:branched-chain amino acid ABC transporter permease n=1 Tax=unclassified Pseudacidovorax TaxID=2620592 RepID=UPI001B468672|nr:branched-chain amino acid ABC transporter permease [Pseudacidovorax sp.]MBP6895579.1 branched-chain amino acid ABC transporter permease [Pseudacidovorax sp.]
MSLDEIWLFLQQGLLSGLVTGSVYALLALAIVAIFKTTDVPNFAQGEMLMMAGYVALSLLLLVKLPYAAVIPITLVAMAVGGALFQRVVMERVTRSRGVGVQLVIATLGLAYLLKGLVRQTGLGDTPRSLPALVSNDTVMIGDAALTHLDIAIFGVAVAVMLLIYFMFTHTRIGKAMRAVGMNPKAAQIVGIRLSSIRMMVWALAGLIAGIAALLITPKVLVTPDIAHIAILAYAAAIVGGFTSLPGAVLGGLLIGVVENMVGLFISTNAIVVAPFLAILVTLIVRPQGLLGGKVQVKKV